MRTSRAEYQHDYWQKNKATLNERTKSYRKAVKLGQVTVKTKDKAHKDIWNIRKDKECFKFQRIGIFTIGVSVCD
jgi:hypothetical protein